MKKAEFYYHLYSTAQTQYVTLLITQYTLQIMFRVMQY
jgi:hypothetical protein